MKEFKLIPCLTRK